MDNLVKIDRLSAWVLFASMLLYFISGYGMTKGIISPSLAGRLHLSYLTYVVMASFVVHTSYAIHLAFKRWEMWGVAGKFILFAFYIIFVSSFVYVDRVYKPSQTQKNVNATSVKEVEVEDEEENEDTPVQITQTSKPSQTQTSSQKTFTADELSKYDGQDGNKAYVAVDGAVYDVTPVFENGSHFDHLAGRDLSNQFYSRHVKSSISKYPVMGILK